MPAIPTQGTTLSLTGGALGATVNVAATDIQVPNIKRGFAEVTSLTSADNYKEFIPTLLEAGEVVVSYYHKGPLSALLNVIEEADEADYKFTATVTLMDNAGAAGTTIEWDGFCTDLGLDTITVGDNAIKGKFTMKVTGKPTYTVSA